MNQACFICGHHYIFIVVFTVHASSSNYWKIFQVQDISSAAQLTANCKTVTIKVTCTFLFKLQTTKTIPYSFSNSCNIQATITKIHRLLKVMNKQCLQSVCLFINTNLYLLYISHAIQLFFPVCCFVQPSWSSGWILKECHQTFSYGISTVEALLHPVTLGQFQKQRYETAKKKFAFCPNSGFHAAPSHHQ